MPVSYISQQEIAQGEEIKTDEIREAIFNFIKIDFPHLDKNHYISIHELNRYRRLYLNFLIEQEKQELSIFDKNVSERIKTQAIFSDNTEDEVETNLTLGQHIADKVASFGGSWTFIISFFMFLLIWMAINTWLLTSRPFDPYPFILLNLVLSCLAAIQAPIIMMSQNRQEQKDRKRAEYDYKINLKAELEIKLINEKIDLLMFYQNKKLIEIQELQTDYLEELIQEIKKNK